MGKDDPIHKLVERFLCPITQDIMKEPVVAADGFTYERIAIVRWIETRGARAISPTTGERLAHHELTPNMLVHSMIQEYLTLQPSIRQKELTDHDIHLAIQLREEELQARLEKQHRQIEEVAAERDCVVQRLGPMEQKMHQLEEENRTLQQDVLDMREQKRLLFQMTQQMQELILSKQEPASAETHTKNSEYTTMRRHSHARFFQQPIETSVSKATDLEPQEFQIPSTPEQQRLQDDLVKVCELGELETVKQLIRDGANPNMLSKDGKHPLGAAIIGCNVESVKFLDEIFNFAPYMLHKILAVNEEKYGIKTSDLVTENFDDDSILKLYHSNFSGEDDFHNETEHYLHMRIVHIIEEHYFFRDGKQVFATAIYLNSSKRGFPIILKYRDPNYADWFSFLRETNTGLWCSYLSQPIKDWNRCKQEVDEFITQRLQQQPCLVEPIQPVVAPAPSSESHEFQVAETPEQQQLQSALVRACELGELERSQQLISEGAHPNILSQDRKHPLGAAIMGCNPEVVRFLNTIHGFDRIQIQKILMINNTTYGLSSPPLIPDSTTYDNFYKLYHNHPGNLGFTNGSFLFFRWVNSTVRKLDASKVRDTTSGLFIDNISWRTSSNKYPLGSARIETTYLCMEFHPYGPAGEDYKGPLDKISVRGYHRNLQCELWNQCKQEVDEFIEQRLRQQPCEAAAARPT